MGKRGGKKVSKSNISCFDSKADNFSLEVAEAVEAVASVLNDRITMKCCGPMHFFKATMKTWQWSIAPSLSSSGVR